jgi:hypothetical protein
MEWRHRLKLGSHLASIESIACRTGWPTILPLDSGLDPLASVVRPYHGPLGEQVEPFVK